jgi:glycosyltransferase involved in cell wall biosynthesis
MAKTAVVFNDYFQTMGGGERSALDYASALSGLGYRIQLVSTKPSGLTVEQITEPFGVKPGPDWSLREFPSRAEFKEAMEGERPDLFVNHCYGSTMQGMGKRNIYVVMFPMHLDDRAWATLATYDAVICISDFVTLHLKLRWGWEFQPITLYSPLSQAHCEAIPPAFEDKQKLILQIGRFNVEGHNKNQLKAIQSFVQAKNEGYLDAEWRLRIIGRVNDSDLTARYLEDCRAAADGNGVEIVTDSPFSFIVESYRSASALVQCTGQGLGWGVSPEQCEHLGLVALDCFAYGTIPIVFERSGAAMLMSHGREGFLYNDEDELADCLRTLAASFGTEAHRSRYRASLARMDDLSFSAFQTRLSGVLEAHVN